MKKDLKRTITIPEGITVSLTPNTVQVKKADQTLEKQFKTNGITLEVKGNELLLHTKGATRRESAMIGTIWAHVSNMITGVQEAFEYQLEICNVHFPMNVKVEGETVVITSFLGETTKRVAKIVSGAKVDVKGSTITISCADIGAAGQTAANIEKASRLKGRDRRIFQDGIFITKKPGRQI